MQRWNVLIDLAVIVLVMNRISIARAAFLIAGKRIVTSRRTIEVPNRAVLLDNNHRSGWRCLTAVSLPSSRIDIAAIKPMSRPFKLVIVESPSKCATISKILSHYVEENDLDFDFVVTASMGHIRNLPKSANKNEIIAGVDVHNQYKPTYEIIQGKQGLVRDLQLLSSDSQCQQVILAMDEDREGEAIAWHIAELLPKASHVRITFTEITPKAILEAIQSPRDINMNLVDAQETRRILDRLAGYTLSPLLWKKIAPGLSAGRVQSVGMALIVQRERQRLNFVRARYWDLAATFESNNVTATLVQVNGQAIASGSDFSNLGHLTNLAKLHLNEEAADDVLISMSGGEMNAWLRDPNASNWTVESLQTNRRTTNPPVAFTTSTLQQEAVRKLGLSVSQTMRVAQALYEAGFITYMRTDSSSMSEDAQKATATSVASRFGTDLVMPPRQAAKSRNAQEAHEAIRPTIQQSGDFLAPNDISSSNEAERRIYKLIYERTIASRMKPQILNSTLVDIKGVSPDGSTVLTFRVTGSVVVSPGYTLAYSESDEVEQFIPDWSKGQHISCDGLYSVSHETKPPPRYTEASFVKKLEEIGVGRPSTYANTLEILRERSYVGTPLKDDDVGIKQRRSRSGTAISAQRAAGGEEFTGGGRGPLVPSLSAFVVCSLLENHLPLYVNETFTAGMEAKLDLIAQGLSDMERNDYLEEFYGGEDGLAAKVQHIEQSVDADEVRRANLPTMAGEEDIALMIGPWGPYIQKLNTSSVPDEKPMTAQLPPGMASDLSTITKASLTALLESRENDGVFIGYHPDSREIYLKTGRYGLFLQTRRRRGEEEDVSNHSLPKRIASMRNLDLTHAGEKGEAALSEMIGLTFEEAVGYVDLPRTVATLDGLDIICGLGPYGGYLKYNNTYVSLRKSDGDLLTLDSETAREIIKSRMLEKKTGE
jgi:DNA topoisomerase-1